MKQAGKYSKYYKLRIFFQIFFFIFFLFIVFYNGPWSGLSELLFLFDPLVFLMNFIATGNIRFILLLSLILLLLTIFFGRFFCGWICPLGAVNNFASWIFRKENKRKYREVRKYFNIKYILLIILIIMSAFGIHLWSWFDPLSIFSRSLSAISPSIDFLFPKTLLLNPDKSLTGDYQKFLVFPYLTILVFFVIIGINYYLRRFYCNILCPLGAVYGLFARIGFMRFSVPSSCNSCGICSRNCSYYGDPVKNFSSAECTVCFNCTVDCPSESVQVVKRLPESKKELTVDISRRRFVGSLITGTLAAAVFNRSVSAKESYRHKFLRPPGSLKEEDFIQSCVRCGLCTQSCPTGFIQQAVWECGIEGIWTPILDANAGICLYDCKRCTEVCPTGSIKKLSLNEKKFFKMGTAIIDVDKCYTYADGFNCTVCFDKCPTIEKAIKFRDVDTMNFMGRESKIKQIYVDPDLCTGCGICENVCPRNDYPGIYMTSADEQREKVTGIM